MFPFTLYNAPAAPQRESTLYRMPWLWAEPDPASSRAASEQFGFTFPHRYDLLFPFRCIALHLLRGFNTCNHSVLPNVGLLESFHLTQDLQTPPRPQWEILVALGHGQHTGTGGLWGGTLLRAVPDSLPKAQALSWFIHTNTQSCSSFCPNILCLTLVVMFYSKCFFLHDRFHHPGCSCTGRAGRGRAGLYRLHFQSCAGEGAANSSLGVSNKENTNLQSA